MKRVIMLFALVFLMAGVFAAEEGEFYTSNFYIFLGLLVLALVIIGVFVWLWIRGPINRWTKKPVGKKTRKPVSQKKTGLGRFLK